MPRSTLTPNPPVCSEGFRGASASFRVRRWPDGAPVEIVCHDGRIKAFTPLQNDGAKLPWAAPMLFDVQVNGYAGVDFQSDAISCADLRRTLVALRRDGCGSIFPTLITDAWETLLARLRRLAQWRAADAELGKSIAGWHIEGPFLSPKPGFHGAHTPQVMRDPRPDDMRRLREAASEVPLLVTLAPERPGAMETIRTAVDLGITVWLGHTDATANQLREAVACGASGFTHFGNGCPSILDRHDNIFWRVLEIPDLRICIIPDGIHVSPPLFRIFHRLIEPERISYTTDAMSAAGAAPGRYRLGPHDLEVGADEVVRLPGAEGGFAGSALCPLHGVFRAASLLACSWQEVWGRFSVQPGRFAGVTDEFHEGGKADFCLIESDSPSADVTIVHEGSVFHRMRISKPIEHENNPS